MEEKKRTKICKPISCSDHSFFLSIRDSNKQFNGFSIQKIPFIRPKSIPCMYSLTVDCVCRKKIRKLAKKYRKKIRKTTKYKSPVECLILVIYCAMSSGSSTLSIFLNCMYFLVPLGMARPCSHFVYSNIWIVLMGRTLDAATMILSLCNVLSLISFHVDDNKMQIIMLSRFIYLQFQSHFQVLVVPFFQTGFRRYFTHTAPFDLTADFIFKCK